MTTTLEGLEGWSQVKVIRQKREISHSSFYLLAHSVINCKDEMKRNLYYIPMSIRPSLMLNWQLIRNTFEYNEMSNEKEDEEWWFALQTPSSSIALLPGLVIFYSYFKTLFRSVSDTRHGFSINHSCMHMILYFLGWLGKRYGKMTISSGNFTITRLVSFNKSCKQFERKMNSQHHPINWFLNCKEEDNSYANF